MNGMLRRLGLGAVIAVASFVPTGAAVVVSVPPRMVVEVDSAHPVLVGSVAATAQAPAERAEILAMVRSQDSVEGNRLSTEALVRTLRSAMPGLDVAGEPTMAITTPGNLRIISMPAAAGGSARVAVPAPLDDATLRRTVDRAVIALAAIPNSAPDAYAGIGNIAQGLASCVDLDRAGEKDALAEIDAIVRALRAGTPGDTALADRSWRGGGYTDVLCGADAHVRYGPRHHGLAPTSNVVTEPRMYGFAHALGHALDAAPPRTAFVPDVAVAWGSSAIPQLRVRAPGAVLTVAGFAAAHPAYVGGRYVWVGPNESYRPADLRDDRLAEIRARLRGIGVQDRAIVTQRDPASGRWFVEVRVTETEPREAIVDAIAGDAERDRSEVRFLRDRVRCAPEPRDVHDAVADAIARARAVARRLGTVADVRRPIAIDLVSGKIEPCTTRETAPYDERIARHVTGSLVLPPADGVVAVAMTVRLRAFALRATAEPALLAPLDPNVVRDQLAPPPVEYPAASTSGEARVDATLPATHVLLTARFEPSSRRSEAMADPSIPAAFAARIGATDANAMSTLTPIPGYASDGRPQREWRTTAVLAARPGLMETITAADAEANAAGNVWTDVVAERQTCGDAPLDVAVRAIRSAASAAAKNGSTRRLVAIDLAGPYVLSGRCDLRASFAQADGLRVASPTVRLAAYARVSYAAR